MSLSFEREEKYQVPNDSKRTKFRNEEQDSQVIDVL